MEKYNFGDAISWITVNEMKASLTLNGIERTYYKDAEGKIICIPNGKEHLAYAIKEFKLDAVLSEDWKLLDK